MSTSPAVVVELPLEGRPLVRIIAMTDGDEARLRAWFERKEVAELLADAAAVIETWREAA